jgi:lambda family phage portal protein
MLDKKDKPSYFIRVLSLLAPEYALKVIRVRAMERVYAGAETYPSSDWTTVSGDTSANAEIDRAQKTLISRSRDLTRNSPYAKKAVDTIVSNVVGAGIVPHLKGRTKSQTKKIMDAWKLVAETNLCDNELRQDFYSLQSLAMRTIAESGEVLAMKFMEPDSPKIQLLEPDFIDSSQVSGIVGTTDNWISGIMVDKNNRIKKYKLYNKHPGDRTFTQIQSKEVDAKDIIHALKVDRAGQLRGVPWGHAVINTLKDFDDFQYATIVRQKIAACLVGVITSVGGDNLLSADKLKQKRKNETKMTPGSFKYLDEGEDVKFSSPPPTQNYSEFVAETIRAVACGFGITYESISNDYSRVNYSSGRMGHIEMRKNLEQWRWNILIPQFCDPYMAMFKEWCKLKGIVANENEITHEWVPPAYSMIDPTKEIEADKEAIKAGLKSKSMVIREQGLDPEQVREEIRLEREADLQAGLNFDVYEAQTKQEENQEESEENVEESEENQEESEQIQDKNRFYTDSKGRIWRAVGDGFEEIKPKV